MSQAVSNSVNHHKINYIELVSTDMERTKRFYSTVFAWHFEEWGPQYASFSAAGSEIDGGFRAGEAEEHGALVILYSADLEPTEQAVLAAGGKIVVPVFSFQGGRRFHFYDGAGSVLAFGPSRNFKSDPTSQLRCGITQISAVFKPS